MIKTFILSLFCFPCLVANAGTFSFDSCVRAVRQNVVPDKRVAIFEPSVKSVGVNKIAVFGRTSSLAAKDSLLSYLSTAGYVVIDSMDVWPFRNVGERCFGVVSHSVIAMNAKPGFSAEMTTQALLGTPVRILEEKDGWLRIQTPDDYIAWATAGSVTRMNKAAINRWNNAPKVIYTALAGTVFSTPDQTGNVVSDVVAGNMFRLVGEKGNCYEIGYPDGRSGFVSKQEAVRVEEWLSEIKITGESLVEKAKQLMGLPYLWGGASPKGVDCSGLIKIVTFLHGIIVQRDASQQAYTGYPVNDFSFDCQMLDAGDLLFFGVPANSGQKERIVHVGMYIGNQQYIHSQTYVHISSFNPEDSNFDEYNKKRFIRAVKILPALNTKGITTIKTNLLYQQQP